MFAYPKKVQISKFVFEIISEINIILKLEALYCNNTKQLLN